MNNQRNYYRILHAQPDAPFEVIRSNYRTLLQKLRAHPDLGGDDWNAALINEAYATLRDGKRRARYDRALLDRYDLSVLATGRVGRRRGGTRPATGPSNRRNYYRILHLQRDAPAALLDASHRLLTADSRRGSAMVLRAYALLSLPGQRRRYDALLERFDHIEALERLHGPEGGRSFPRPYPEKIRIAQRKRVTRPPFEPVITRYCPFCKSPAPPRETLSPERSCAECMSPLPSPRRPPAALGEAGAREALRRRAEGLITFYTYWPGPQRIGSILDLSATGVRVETALDLAPGAVVKLEAPAFRALGEVVHREATERGYAVGLRFLSARFYQPRGNFLRFTA